MFFFKKAQHRRTGNQLLRSAILGFRFVHSDLPELRVRYPHAGGDATVGIQASGRDHGSCQNKLSFHQSGSQNFSTFSCITWINFDAAIFGKERNMGCGIIVRDSEGSVLAVLSKKIYGITNPEHVEEAISAGEAARFGYDCGFNFVQMEGDAKLIINALNSSEEILSAIGEIIDDVKRIAHCFDTFQHIKRSGNEAAHGLAKFAYSLTEALILMGEVPPVVMPSILKDCNIFNQ
ncbi:hypothetical protein RJ640_010760 [Escallonia rubra]|uniref:RNase H type-1 domain-containing protein n=1 Tax=Escallonia rubra TaxID=112253 RepID=A0AA88RBF0_9ASTE|nr:hypothetical protein RJ640_010760 [Escallonia rubra]